MVYYDMNEMTKYSDNCIDGKQIAQKIYDQIKEEVKTLIQKPCMAAILVGDSPASKVYINQKEKWAKYVGINFKLIKLEKNIQEITLINEIEKLNKDKKVNGYIVQLPLPWHINENAITKIISAQKDIDGFVPINMWNCMIGNNDGFLPCTPAGIMEIFTHKNIELKWKLITVIGRSNIVWKPISILLINAWATVVNCNKETPKDILSQSVKQSDIIVVAAWSPHLIKADMVKSSAIIIDVWITRWEDGKLYWDADYNNLIQQGNIVTPVPGWVWPLTVAMLMKNTLKAHKLQNCTKKS